MSRNFANRTIRPIYRIYSGSFQYFCFAAVISKRMSDQIIDVATARSVQANAAKAQVLFGWIIQHDPPEHPGKYVARFATAHPTIYVMLADTLAELQAMLPTGLARSPRQPVDPPEVAEIWFSK